MLLKETVTNYLKSKNKQSEPTNFQTFLQLYQHKVDKLQLSQLL